LPIGRLNGKAGEVVAPAGKPEIAIDTESANPFCPAVETVKLELEVSGSAVTVAGDTMTLKSLGAVLVVGGADPLPHPTRVDNHNATQTMYKEPESVPGHAVARGFTNYIQPFPSHASTP
jgi:hypothetical protein